MSDITTKRRLYAIYDLLAEEAGPIFEAKNDAVAARSISNLLISNGVKNIQDYELVFIGDVSPAYAKHKVLDFSSIYRLLSSECNMKQMVQSDKQLEEVTK